jgi:hypothetical protein
MGIHTTWASEQETKAERAEASSASSWLPSWFSSKVPTRKQHTRTKSSWLAMDNHVQISPEIEQKITELQKFASKLVFQISETIQGSSELQSLTKIQQTLLNLIVNIPARKTGAILQHEDKHRAEQSQAESKEQAAATSPQASSRKIKDSTDENSIKKTMQTILEIHATLTTLQETITQRLKKYEDDLSLAAPEDASLIESLRQKIEIVKKLIEQFEPLRKIASQTSQPAEPSMGLESTHDIVIDTEALKTQLEFFKQHIDKAIPYFKTGLSGVLDRTINDLTVGLNGVVKNLSITLSAQLKAQLTEVIGYPAILALYTSLDYIIQNQQSMDDETFQTEIVKVLNAFGCTINGLDDQSSMIQTLLDIQSELSDKYEYSTIEIKLNRANFIKTKAIETARTRLSSLLKTNSGLHGTLTDITSQMKEKLLDVVKELNKGFNTELRHTVNNDLPRTFKKGIGYLTLGTIAACAVCHIIWHDLPWKAHAKNIGIATTSLLGMFLVDPVINYFYPPSRTPAAQ